MRNIALDIGASGGSPDLGFLLTEGPLLNFHLDNAAIQNFGDALVQGPVRFLGQNGSAITNGSTLTLSGAEPVTLSDLLVNNTATGTLVLWPPNHKAAKVDLSSCTIENHGVCSSAGPIQLSGPNSVFLNEGSYSANNDVTEFNIVYGNDGATSVQAQAELHLDRGGSNSGVLNNGGTMVIGAGQTFTTNGSYNQTGGALNLRDGSTFNVTGGQFQASGGTIDVRPGASVFANRDLGQPLFLSDLLLHIEVAGIINSRNLNVFRSTINVAGTCSVTGDCSLSQCTLEDDGTCNVGGSCNVTGGSCTVGSGATFTCGGYTQSGGALTVTGSCTVTGDCSLSQCTLEDDGTCNVGGSCNVTGGSCTIGSGATLHCVNLSVDHGRFDDNGKLDVTGDANFTGGVFNINGFWTAEGRKIRANDNSSWQITPHGQARLFSPLAAGNLSLDNCTFDVNGKLDVSGDANFSGGVFTINTGAATTIDGNFSARRFARVLIQQGRLLLDSDMPVLLDALDRLLLDGPLLAEGEISAVNSPIQIGPHGKLDSAGQILLQGGSSLSGLPGAVVTAPTLILQDSTLSGSLTFNGDLVNGGTVMPGILNINGDYTQTASGDLKISIAGYNAGTDFGQVNVKGTANLAGTLDAVVINGFVPVHGSEFHFLNRVTNGQFTTVNLDPIFVGIVYDPLHGVFVLA